DRAQYNSAQRHLAAEGNVVLLDLATGSRIESPTLDYFEAMEGRPQSTVEIYSGRPRTSVVRDVVEDGLPRSDTTIVDADALTIVGEDAFHYRGNVVITGRDLNATSGVADFLEGGARVELRNAARVTAEDVVLNGDTVIALQDTVAGELREVEARGSARLDAEEIDIEAPTIRTFFEAGAVQRLVALGADSASGPERRQAYAFSEQFNLSADSIDALLPNQRIEEVVAVGNAYGERLAEDDSARIRIEPLTPQDSAVARLLAHDWVRGDTIRAFFADAVGADSAGLEAGRVAVADAERPVSPDSLAPVPADGVAPADTTERGLRRIIALGAPARAANRMVDEDRPDDPAGISYITAQRITVEISDGAIDIVEAEGDVKGIYLQPPERPVAVAAGAGPCRWIASSSRSAPTTPPSRSRSGSCSAVPTARAASSGVNGSRQSWRPSARCRGRIRPSRRRQPGATFPIPASWTATSRSTSSDDSRPMGSPWRSPHGTPGSGSASGVQRSMHCRSAMSGLRASTKR